MDRYLIHNMIQFYYKMGVFIKHNQQPPNHRLRKVSNGARLTVEMYGVSTQDFGTYLIEPGLEVIKLFMLNSTEHGIYPAH